jgi:hypothetical protein
MFFPGRETAARGNPMPLGQERLLLFLPKAGWFLFAVVSRQIKKYKPLYPLCLCGEKNHI